MPRVLFSLLAMLTVIPFISCDKDSPADEAILHGVWVKGSNTGDTLKFYSRSGVHYMFSNQSFNEYLYAPLEREYQLRNDHLSLRFRGAWQWEDVPVESFKWIKRGEEFEVNGIELYMFMSSLTTRFTFRKIQ